MSLRAIKWAIAADAGKATDNHVLLVLANYHYDRDGECRVGIDKIVAATRLNPKTVKDALARLREGELIDYDPGNKRHRNYSLNFDSQSTKLGRLESRGNTSNFGTLKNHSNQPELGLLGQDSNSPKRKSQSTKNASPIAQDLGHTQEHGNTQDITPYSPPAEKFDAEQMPLPSGINPSAWIEWAQFRKKRKPAITQLAATKQFKLLSQFDEQTQQDIIDTSIQNDYQGLFPPKGRQPGSPDTGKSSRYQSIQDDLTDTSWANGGTS